jgi:hypothetical protein
MTTNTNTMAPEQVATLIESKGTKIATVSFIKADGTIRVINGLFKPSSKIVGSERGQMQGEAMRARGQVPVYELTSSRWKSFYADKVLEIK